MAERDPKYVLHRYLKVGREALLWKLDGLSEYDMRRPVVPTGTNLLGLVKHVASVEVGYFTEVFGRPLDVDLPWNADDAEPNADMWATSDETSESVIALYRRSWELSDATIDDLALDAVGQVPWWGDDGDVTLQLILVHMIAETHRHAGHADLAREMIDGRAGWREGSSNLPAEDHSWWQRHHDRIGAAAVGFRS